MGENGKAIVFLGTTNSNEVAAQTIEGLLWDEEHCLTGNLSTYTNTDSTAIEGISCRNIPDVIEKLEEFGDKIRLIVSGLFGFNDTEFRGLIALARQKSVKVLVFSGYGLHEGLADIVDHENVEYEPKSASVSGRTDTFDPFVLGALGIDASEKL